MRLIICSFFIISFFPLGTCAVELTIVTELSPPNQTLINNQVVGTSTEIVNAIVDKANIDADITLYPWARAYKMAYSKPNTLIYSIARTQERLPYFHWIGVVARFDMGFVKLTKRHDITVKHLAQAKKYRIAVQRDDLASQELKKMGFELIFTADIKNSYALLLAGKVDLIIDDPNYLHDMEEYLSTKKDSVEFVFAIDELAVDGYLAANINTSAHYIARLKAAYAKVAKSPLYLNNMSQ